ncbi:MAG: reverse transcriptase domain-containing protein [Cyanobacteria bacterium P01_D01_bin.105]
MMSTDVNVVPHRVFRKYFGVRSLQAIYQSKVKGTRLKGVDRIDSSGFSRKRQNGKSREREEIRIISRKALDSTYMFSPYLELLKGKGRDKNPRVLAIPTIRDRIALHALKEVLFEIFPECVNRRFANTVIRDINQACMQLNKSQLGFFRTDISNFYGSIDRGELLSLIGKKVRSKKVKTMLRRAMTRPIVPKIYSKRQLAQYEVSGIPQGLSISNILAEIYMYELDGKMKNDPQVLFYSRYVDDILVISNMNHLPNVVSRLRAELEPNDALGLKLNESKTYTNSAHLTEFNLSNTFEYLGYQFSDNMVPSPKRSSEEKLIRSVTGLFCEYKSALRVIKKSRKKVENKRFESECLRKTFMFRLNEKITGALSEKKKYGWMFYFIEIGDRSSLYRIDAIFSRMLTKTEGLDSNVPPILKKLARTYFEAIHSPERGYIHNYNRYNSSEKRRDFLIEHGYIDARKSITLKKSDRKFYAIRNYNLSKLLQDETFLY